MEQDLADPLHWSWLGPQLGRLAPIYPWSPVQAVGRAFFHRASPIHADHWGMPGPRELSFAAAPKALSSRGHIPESMCLSTLCLFCPSSLI